MPNKKITQLTINNNPSLSDVFPVVNDGITKQLSFTGLTAFIAPYIDTVNPIFTGGTVSGTTSFTNGITTSTISATTYQNLPLDIRVTGGTYSDGTIIFTNNTGGTFNVTGLTSNSECILRPYKVYTALLTQTGGDNQDSTIGDEGLLLGVTYTITANPDNYDLIPYGAPNSNVGTSFVSTSDGETLPYTASLILTFNSGAPLVTVLENTIGNIWFTYDSVGVYVANSDNLFTINKTVTEMLPERYIENPETIYSYQCFPTTPNKIAIMGILDNESADNTLGTYAQNVIEIRVYN
jgi:hypothetical protein